MLVEFGKPRFWQIFNSNEKQGSSFQLGRKKVSMLSSSWLLGPFGILGTTKFLKVEAKKKENLFDYIVSQFFLIV